MFFVRSVGGNFSKTTEYGLGYEEHIRLLYYFDVF